MRWQYIPRNPLDAVAPLKQVKADRSIWNAVEIVRFLDTAISHRLYALFYLALSTGMRRGEILGLTWEDIQENVITVRRNMVDIKGTPTIGTPKTKKGQRRVTISQDVIDVLKAHKAKQDAEGNPSREDAEGLDLVFTSEIGGNIHPRNLLRTWFGLQKKTRQKWVKDLGEMLTFPSHIPQEAIEKDIKSLEEGKTFPKLRFHDLRHLHTSIAIRDGMDAKMLANKLGHAKASFTLDVYTHLFDEQRQSSAVSIVGLPKAGRNPASIN